MTMEELAIVIRVSADGVAETIGEIKEELDNLTDSVEDMKRDSSDPFRPMTEGAEKAAAAQAILATAAAATFAQITAAVNTGTEAYNAYVSAAKGLESIADGKGINTEALQASLEGVTDGFFSATAAAQAYKNLLTRGYSLEQATTTIERLKDAAAFGRAANLSLEDAVVSATEGIRQENSVLVNAA